MFYSCSFKKWLPLVRWLDFLCGTDLLLQLGVCEYLKPLNIDANNAIFHSTLNRIALFENAETHVSVNLYTCDFFSLTGNALIQTR